jgi:hypothetical protein
LEQDVTVKVVVTIATSLSAHPTESGHFPVRLDSYIIKFAYSTSIPMDALEKHLENATAKGAS